MFAVIPSMIVPVVPVVIPPLVPLSDVLTAVVSKIVAGQKILDHPGVVLNEPIGALVHLGVARAYALSGDTAKSKTAYQDFFALWKDADPDIPILKEAKAEYAKVQ
jgi:hypothetical protein